jgi:hypothetical protein
VRYRQQFIDRLWMRGLAGLGLAYLLFVLAYFAWLRVLEYRLGATQRAVATLTPQYTNALELKARVAVLQDQFNLRFAALDCWKATCETLPEGMTLTSMAFQRGRKLALFGTVRADEQSKVTEFNEALSKVKLNSQPLFAQVNTRSIQAPAGTGGPQGDRPASWSIECELRRMEVE